MTASVKDLIRSIRSSKTASEERAVLAKECAKIRSSLNSDNVSSRRKNISKLLFIHLLGYPTNFGQVECIKLIASSKFADKRIGYLALNVLLTEDSEVLMLSTNSIKIDLNNPNPYICEMALRSLANIGTTEMLRELQYEIERLLNSNVPNIKKKAAVCTVRMLRKEANRNLTPDNVSMELARSFLKYVDPLVSDYDNGVKTAGLSLMSVLLEQYTDVCNLPQFFQLLLRTLGNSMAPDNTNFTATIPSTTEGFTTQNLSNDQVPCDPFLKVKLLSQLNHVYLKLLSNKSQMSMASPENCDLLGGAPDFNMTMLGYKDQLYDVVSRMINSIEVSNNSNDAILYQCASSIDCLFFEEKFNELGKLVVKKFMAGPSNNAKYLALGIIKKLHNVQMVHGDSNWMIIVQSFKQPDVSIRMKALDVALKVVNKSTLEPLVQYLYEFLLSADDDLKRDSMHRIFNCVNQHSDDLGYKLQVFVKIFTIAGNSVQDVILFDFIDLLSSSSDEVKVSTTLELLKVLRYNMGQSALVKSSLYSVGEYYQLLSNADLKGVFTSYRPPNVASRGTVLNNVKNVSRTGVGAPVDSINSLNDTSVDLLLDLSTPTNRNGADDNGRNKSYEGSKEDDFLLDLSTPTNDPNPPATSEADLFDLSNLNSAVTGAVNSTSNDSQANKDDDLDLSTYSDRNGCTNSDQEGDLLIVQLIEDVAARLIAKNLLNECEYLLTCIAKLVYKMPGRVGKLRKILKRFRRHSNPELQQRSCELDVIIQENMMTLMDPSKKESIVYLDADKDLTSLYSGSEKDTDLSGLYTTKQDYKAKEKEEDFFNFEGGDKAPVIDDFFNSSVPVQASNSTSLNPEDKNVDLFDDFFTSNNPSDSQKVSNAFSVTGAVRSPEFNSDKMADIIAENVAVVSSRDKREDDFQQFDPF